MYIFFVVVCMCPAAACRWIWSRGRVPVTVPDGATGGQRITVVARGQHIQVAVPKWLEPGDTFSVRPPRQPGAAAPRPAPVPVSTVPVVVIGHGGGDSTAVPVIVPNGVTGGQQLTVTVRGVPTQVVVPQGLVAGGVFMVQPPQVTNKTAPAAAVAGGGQKVR